MFREGLVLPEATQRVNGPEPDPRCLTLPPGPCHAASPDHFLISLFNGSLSSWLQLPLQRQA